MLSIVTLLFEGVVYKSWAFSLSLTLNPNNWYKLVLKYYKNY